METSQFLCDVPGAQEAVDRTRLSGTLPFFLFLPELTVKLVESDLSLAQ